MTIIFTRFRELAKSDRKIFIVFDGGDPVCITDDAEQARKAELTYYDSTVYCTMVFWEDDNE